MHYVLLWWFEEKVKPKLRGYCGLIVYADDFVACFQYKEEAEEFYSRLKHRMEHFGLSLEEEKSRLIEFGRFAKERAEREGKKTGTFGLSGLYTLRFRKQERKVPGEEENQQKEAAKEKQGNPCANQKWSVIRKFPCR